METNTSHFADDAVCQPDKVDTPDQYDGQMMWCLHCERVYPYGWHRVKIEHKRPMAEPMEFHYCPYEGCDGDVVIDAKPWEWARQGKGYPEDPDLGKRYPLYGDN